MPYIEWDAQLDTGVAGIDHEHRKLVQLLNDIHELFATGADPRGIAECLADFHMAATAHFALEENIMRDQKYPGFGERRQTHHRLLDEVRDIMDAYDAGSTVGAENVPDKLWQWLFQAMIIDVDLFAKLDAAKLRQWGLTHG